MESNKDNLDREGAGDEYPDQQDTLAQPGMSGGEFPGAEGVTDDMSEHLVPEGQDTTFGGQLGDYGPAGTMGTIDEGNAADSPPPPADDTQYGLGPDRQ